MRIPYPIYEAIPRYATQFERLVSDAIFEEARADITGCPECEDPTKEHLCWHLDNYAFSGELWERGNDTCAAMMKEHANMHNFTFYDGLVEYLRSEFGRDDKPGDPEELKKLVHLRLKIKERKTKVRSRALTEEQKLTRLKAGHARNTTQKPYSAKLVIKPNGMLVYRWASPIEAFSCCCLDNVPEAYQGDLRIELAKHGITVKTIDNVDYVSQP